MITHWSTPGQGRPASVPALIARITIDHADGTRQVHHDRRHVGARSTGPWMQGPPRNDEGDFVEVDRRPAQPGRLGPHRVRRPQLVAGRGARPASRRAVPAPVRGAQPHRGARDAAGERSTRMSDGSYVADYGSVIAATPVVELARGRRGPRGEDRRRLSARSQRPRVDHPRHATNRHALGLHRARRSRRSSGRSTISASATSRSIGAGEPLGARRRGRRRAPRVVPRRARRELHVVERRR